MRRGCAVGATALLLAASLPAARGSVIAKYYSRFNWEEQKCEGKWALKDGKMTYYDDYMWREVDKPYWRKDSASDHIYGPRGQKDQYCVEWYGKLNLSPSVCIRVDADDGVLIQSDDAKKTTYLDAWNSFDDRGCHNANGQCKAPGGSVPLKITYYQDYGESHFVLWSGPCGSSSGWKEVPKSAWTKTSPKVDPTKQVVDVQDPKTAAANKNKLDWALLGRIGKISKVYRTTFWTGLDTDQLSYYTIQKCTDMLHEGTNGHNEQDADSNKRWEIGNSLGENEDQVVIKVTMGTEKGNVTDYYKPIPGENLCTMLMSNTKHLWSSTGQEGTFIQPMYHHSAYTLGGSDSGWPKRFLPDSTRIYTSFWGGNGDNGGCCHYSDTDPKDKSRWNRELEIMVRPLLPLPKQTLTAALPPASSTPVDKWVQVVHLNHDWNTGYKDIKTWDNMLDQGIFDTWAGVHSGAFFLRKPSMWKGKKVVVALCVSNGAAKEKDTPTCTGKDIIVDYFKPKSGVDLEGMLKSDKDHMWAYDIGKGHSDMKSWKWVNPQPFEKNDGKTRLYRGGSKSDWVKQFCHNACSSMYSTSTDCEKGQEMSPKPAQSQCKWIAGIKNRKGRCEARLTKDGKAPAPMCPEVDSVDKARANRRYVPFWAGHMGGLGVDAKWVDTWYHSYSLMIAEDK